MAATPQEYSSTCIQQSFAIAISLLAQMARRLYLWFYPQKELQRKSLHKNSIRSTQTVTIIAINFLFSQKGELTGNGSSGNFTEYPHVVKASSHASLTVFLKRNSGNIFAISRAVRYFHTSSNLALVSIRDIIQMRSVSLSPWRMRRTSASVKS